MSHGQVWGLNYFQAAFSSSFTYPFTIVNWIKKNASQWDASGSDYVFSFGADFTADDDYIRVATVRDQVLFTARASSASSNASVSFANGTYDDIWVPVVFVVTAINDRDGYVEDSSQTGASTSSKTLAALDSFRVGRLMTSIGGFEGLIGDQAIFDKALSTAEINTIVTTAGSGPELASIAPSNCLAWWSTVLDTASYADLGANSGPTLVKDGTSPTYSADHHGVESVGGLLLRRRR